MHIVLSNVEARVLGALVEKDITTPDYYPLSLNALINACNQKNNREPVMSLEEGAVRDALNGLHDDGLAACLTFDPAAKISASHRRLTGPVQADPPSADLTHPRADRAYHGVWVAPRSYRTGSRHYDLHAGAATTKRKSPGINATW